MECLPRRPSTRRFVVTVVLLLLVWGGVARRRISQDLHQDSVQLPVKRLGKPGVRELGLFAVAFPLALRHAVGLSLPARR